MAFQTTQAAIAVLRAGKKHPRWKEAAEFVIERATPEVKLLLAVGRQLERDAIAEKKALEEEEKSNLKPLVYVAGGLGLLSVVGLAGYFLYGLVKLC